jgi:hypothetical protein
VSWQEQRRLNEAARAEQARQDAVAAAQVEQIRTRTRVEATQSMAAAEAEQERVRRAERDRERAQARARRAGWWAGVRGWCAAHTVDLLIYPLAVVSAVMAVPAMAAFGHAVYGTAAGYALPVITELGMWAFAFAVHLVRHRTERDGADRPVWALQIGVWSFATVAAGLNFLHGLTTGFLGGAVTGGVVMAVASVAGVVAHQLVTAAPRRGRIERATAQIERRAVAARSRFDRQSVATVARVRRAALRAAVAEIDQDGAARLLFAPGRYRLTRSWFAPWRRGRLDPVTLPGLPVTPANDTGWDDLDRELAVLLTTVDPYPGTGNRPGTPPAVSTGGGVATLDPGTDRHPDDDAGDQPRSTPRTDPIGRSRSDRKSSPARPRKSRAKDPTSVRGSARSIEELAVELRGLIEVDPGSIDPTSAESIRRALHCSPARARALRDTYRPADRGDLS